jgi:transcriptional regulator with XRE-family HTH domain
VTAPAGADAVDGLLYVGNGKTDNEVFGRILRTCRRELDKSARDVADEVGVSATFVRAIERGDQAPSEDTARRLWNAVNPGFPTSRPRPDIPELVITDPDSDELFLCQFTASRKGDNSKWSLERLQTTEPGQRLAQNYANHLLSSFLEAWTTPARWASEEPEERVETFHKAFEAWLARDQNPPRVDINWDTGLEPPSRMELLGRLMLRLAEADMATLLRVEKTLTAAPHSPR